MSPLPDRYAVVGNPVAHSQSPFIHSEFARQTDQLMTYTRLLSPLDGFAATVREFAASGARGCNVTVPFKFEVPALAQHASPRVLLAQAANTLRFDAQGWHAENTDGLGLRQDLEVNAGFKLQGRHVLLLGAGGAAAGVLGPLIEARPALLQVINRTAAKAQDLVQRHADLASEYGVQLCASSLQPEELRPQGYELIINASSSSLQGDTTPIPPQAIGSGCLVLDMMYGPASQPFLQWAASYGAATRDGLGMLVEQAAEAFAFWRGIRPATADVLRALRERVNAAPAP